jgi:hypothetical protein
VVGWDLYQMLIMSEESLPLNNLPLLKSLLPIIIVEIPFGLLFHVKSQRDVPPLAQLINQFFKTEYSYRSSGYIND